MKGILGRKAGMTHIFTSDGKAIPVTVIEVKPNVVLQAKTEQTDGYIATKLAYEEKKESRVNKPDLGQFKKANATPKYFIKEIRNMSGHEMGATIDASIIDENTYVDVTGISKGKGFQGSIKRHNYSIGPKSHGSKYHRGSGSLGSITGTVKKTKKLPGHMGYEQTTIQNLVVLKVDLENNYILVRGSIPGPNKSFVIVKQAIKNSELKTNYSLVNLKEEKIKNELFEEGKKYAAILSSTMSIEEMRVAVAQAKELHETQAKEHEDLVKQATELGITNPTKLSLDELRTSISKTLEIEAQKEAQNNPKEEAQEAAQVEAKQEVVQNEVHSEDRIEVKEESEIELKDEESNKEEGSN